MLKQYLSKFSIYLANLITEKDFDLPHQLKKQSTKEAVEFFYNHMQNVQVFKNKKSMLDFELKNVTKEGLYLEFGVAKAEHTNYIATKIQPELIHGFDSFFGFPEYFDGVGSDFHNYNGKPPNVKKNVVLHNGYFKNTLPEFSKNNSQKIIGYGSPAKATTALNFFGISKEIEYIIEDNKLKQGKYLPGVKIPILNNKQKFNKNSSLLILAWNFFDEIKRKNEKFYKNIINIKSLEKDNFLNESKKNN